MGLVYAQARYYDPVIGRFYSPDPIGSADQFNLFAYVGNDPVNQVDPTGKFTQAYINSLSVQAVYSNSHEAKVAITVDAINQGKAGTAFVGNAADALAVGSMAFGQVEIATVATAVSTAASVMGNSLDHDLGDVITAQASGEVAAKAAENTVQFAALTAGVTDVDGKVQKSALAKVSGALNMAGAKGKVASAVLNGLGAVATFASQQAGAAVTEKVLEESDRNRK